MTTPGGFGLRNPGHRTAFDTGQRMGREVDISRHLLQVSLFFSVTIVRIDSNLHLHERFYDYRQKVSFWVLV